MVTDHDGIVTDDDGIIGSFASNAPDWMRDGACNEYPSGWFFEKIHFQAARVVCRSCAVRSECGDYAMQAGIVYGTWGGLTPLARQRAVKLGLSTTDVTGVLIEPVPANLREREALRVAVRTA